MKNSIIFCALRAKNASYSASRFDFRHAEIVGHWMRHRGRKSLAATVITHWSLQRCGGLHESHTG
jgi:hypothetical protein